MVRGSGQYPYVTICMNIMSHQFEAHMKHRQMASGTQPHVPRIVFYVGPLSDHAMNMQYDTALSLKHI